MPTKRIHTEKGAVVVEFAIILPLLALLLLGTLEFGSIARDYQVLQNAAREGARLSALPANENNQSTIQNRVVAYLQNEYITVAPADVVVNQAFPMPIGSLTGVRGSKVTVTYNRSLIFPGITSFVPLGTLQLKGTALFRNFY